jgi:hypothetical protein
MPSTAHPDNHTAHWSLFHDSSKITSKSNNLGPITVTESKASVKDCVSLESLAKTADHQKLSVGINKNSILTEYEEFVSPRLLANQDTTAVKDETPLIISYPSHHHLIANCKMKPSPSLYYRVKDLHFDNVVIFIVMSYKLYLTDAELANLKSLNKMYREMVDNILWLRSVNFSSLKRPRLGYTNKTAISFERVDLATSCAIHYGLHVGMFIRYIKGEYVSEIRNADGILK